MTSRLAALRSAQSGHALTGEPIGSLPAYLAMDTAGHPALAVPAKGAGVAQSMDTEYLSLRLFVDLTLTETDGTTTSGWYHLLTCKQSGPGVNEPFEAVAVGLAEGLRGTDDVGVQLTTAFSALCELFRTKPATDLGRARTGLWGELFLMRETGGFVRWAPYWHTETGRKYDFSCENRRLEVKATTKETRVHIFSHGQLYSFAACEIVIASLVLRYEDAGLSLQSLVNEARSALAGRPQELLKLEKAVRAAGLADGDEDGPLFDEEEARAKLRFFPVDRVPRFPMAEPPGVTGTTYTASLSTATPLTDDESKTFLATWDSVSTLRK